MATTPVDSGGIQSTPSPMVAVPGAKEAPVIPIPADTNRDAQLARPPHLGVHCLPSGVDGDEQGMRIHGQPIVDLRQGKCTGLMNYQRIK